MRSHAANLAPKSPRLAGTGDEELGAERSAQLALSVAVVNFNTREHLRSSLSSILPQAPSAVVVVDNASSDGSVEMVRSAYPSVSVLANSVNRGYGAAANQAVAGCASPYVLLLNSDTALRPGALAALGAHLDDHPAAAVVGPRLLNADGTAQPSCFPFPGPLYTFLQVIFFGSLVSRAPGLRARYRPSPEGPDRVPWLLGAALAIRRDAFVAVGGFDESFFMYSEEVDLCYRLGRAGWEVHFTPLAEVTHVGGASTQQQPVEMEAQRYAATRRFYEIHYSRWARYVLTILMSYRMLHNLLRDTARIRLTRETGQRAQLAVQLAVWRQVLKAAWRG
jgi:GT2 family glycosyltransferase